MPRMNGYEVARRIRQTEEGKAALLMALTGWGQKEDIEKSLNAGFDFHMTKLPTPSGSNGCWKDSCNPLAAHKRPRRIRINTAPDHHKTICVVIAEDMTTCAW